MMGWPLGILHDASKAWSIAKEMFRYVSSHYIADVLEYF